MGSNTIKVGEIKDEKILCASTYFSSDMPQTYFPPRLPNKIRGYDGLSQTKCKRPTEEASVSDNMPKFLMKMSSIMAGDPYHHVYRDHNHMR